MKKIIFLFILLSAFFFSDGYADDYNDLINEYKEEYTEEFEKSMAEVQKNSDLKIPAFEPEKIISDAVKGKIDFSDIKISNIIYEILMPEFKRVSKSMLYLLTISLIGSFLINLNGAELSKGAAQAGNMCLYLVSAGIILNVFSDIASIAYNTVNTLALFLKSIFPVIIMSLYSAGCITSITVLRPLLAWVVQISSHVIINILMPVIVFSYAITVADCLSEKIKADKFSALMIKTVKWLLTCMLTVFIGMIGLQSVAASTFDGLTVKLTKLVTSNLVPIVGGLLAETVETVMNCSVVIKNSVGICGILAVVYICVYPLLRMGVNIIFLRFTAAVMQPVSDERIIKCLVSTADLLSLLFGIVASVAVMFVLIITIIINTGNSAVMLGR